MDLNHAVGHLYDAKTNALISDLIDAGALPNCESGGITFKTVAGTWRELNPDNPEASLAN